MANKIQIVGAGFSGLTLAYYLNKLGADVVVFEKEPRVGGVLQTDITPFGQVEKAARGIMNTRAFEKLCAEIDCELIAASKASKKRYIFKEGKLKKWPLSIGKSLALMWSVLRRRKQIFLKLPTSTTVKEWVDSQFDLEVDRYLISPALQGVFARGSDALSGALIYKNFIAKNSNHSLELPRVKGLVYPKGGMQCWSEKLKDYLVNQGVAIRLGHKLPSVESLQKPYVIATSLADAIQMDAIPHNLGLSMQPVVVVNAFFQRPSKKLDGFGCLFPRGEGVEALGVVSNTNTFSGLSENHSETWIYSGDEVNKSNLDEDIWIKKMLSDRQVALSEHNKPLYIKVTLWENGIPAYDSHLAKFVEEYKHGGGAYLFGNYLGKIGLGKIVEDAELLAAKVVSENSTLIS